LKKGTEKRPLQIQSDKKRMRLEKILIPTFAGMIKNKQFDFLQDCRRIVNFESFTVISV
jgi:hypothetical protein